MILIKKKSRIHGKGVFTKEEILKNRIIHTVTLEKIYLKHKKRCAYIGENRWVEDKILNFINHSCCPNTILIFNRKNPIIKSIKKINKGEEITLNYNKTEKGKSKVRCKCGSDRCKGYFKIKCL